MRGVLALMEQDVDPNTACPEKDYTPLIAAVFNQVRYAYFRGVLCSWFGYVTIMLRLRYDYVTVTLGWF